MVKFNIKKIIQYVYQSVFFMALSFLIKYLALLSIKTGSPLNNKVFSLFFVKNTGAAFSLLQYHTDSLIILSSIVILSIILYVIKNSYKLSKLKIAALAIVTAGISGNLYERIHDGYVIDYIRLNFINFPVFNAFDALITIGAILLIIALYKNK